MLFFQTAAVTCLAWPSQGPLIIGLADGKVRAAFIKNNKVLIHGALYTLLPRDLSLKMKYSMIM